MSDADVNRLMAAYRTSGTLVDTNLLLLYLVGLLDPRLIVRFKRTASFNRSEYQWLAGFLAQINRVVTTPTVLAEVNGLANQLPERNKPRFHAIFRERIGLLEERYEPSHRVCEHEHFARCGLTDAAIMSVSRERLLVLTIDAKLSALLNRLGIDNMNFNHLRSYLLER
jgi:hypothetical protein